MHETTYLRDALALQRRAFLSDGPPDAALRRDRLRRAAAMLLDRQDAIVAALREDFGQRSAVTTKAAEILGSVSALRHADAELENWVAPEPRPLLPGTAGPGARAEIRYQPLGVVGLISPWNAPILLCFAPLAGILAAGNRALIKPSEFAPASAALIAEMVAAAFDPAEIAVFTGDATVGRAFASLPFDHLMFTGSTATAKRVMAAAAENLVPVTLELGGKSPVIVGRSADLAVAARRIVNGKMMNGGQVCISPDYVFVPCEAREAFVAACREAAAEQFPSLLENEDYTGLISTAHVERLRAMLADARARGAEIVEINPAGESFDDPATRKLPLSLIVGETAGMRVMQEEIFGPILPILSYDSLDEVTARINTGERPLALYYFGQDEAEAEWLLAHTWSGNVAINDVVAQGLREEIPYGGVGASGMGAYKGRDGFRTFSHAKPIFYQTDLDAALAPMRAPYSGATLGYVEDILRQMA